MLEHSPIRHGESIAMRHTLPILVALLSVPLSGCLAVVAAAGAGFGYHQYEENEVVRDFPATLENAWNAALEAVKGAGHSNPATRWLGPTEGEIEDGDIRVRVEKLPEGVSRVRVRIGTFQTDDHDRRAALLLMDIQSRLGIEPTAPGSTDQEPGAGLRAEA